MRGDEGLLVGFHFLRSNFWVKFRSPPIPRTDAGRWTDGSGAPCAVALRVPERRLYFDDDGSS